MATKALLVGINSYATAPLRGCINDVTRVRELLTQRYRLADERIRVLTDGAATKAAIAENLAWLAQTDDEEGPAVRLFHFSGHGIFEADTNGEEQDGRDECLVPYDFGNVGMLTDDTLRAAYARFSTDTHLLLLMDCCHSGGSQKDIANDIVYRYMRRSDAEETQLQQEITQATERNRELRETYVAKRLAELLQRQPGSLTEDELRQYVQGVMAQFDKDRYGMEQVEGNVVLIAACRADQTAADARFGDGYNGALTYHLTEALASAGGQLPYTALMKQISQGMGTRFTQVPQLECSKACVDLPFLRDALT